LNARLKLLESLDYAPTKRQPAVRMAVPPKFVKDFEAVAAHYNLKALGEYDQAKEAARNDLENAITCYAHLAAEIREENA